MTKNKVIYCMESLGYTILSKCLKFKEIQRVKSGGLEKNKGKLILLTKCVVFESKKSRFMETKKQTHC